MNTAHLRLPDSQYIEARIAEARLLGNLRTIHADGGMKAVLAAVQRALREVAREMREEGWCA